MGTPCDQRGQLGVVVRVIVHGHVDGQTLGEVAAILGVERHGAVLGVACDEYLAPAPCHDHRDAAHVALGNERQLGHPQDVLAAHLGMAAVGQEAFSGYLTSGIPGHIFLSSAPLVPVMFYYWLKNPGRIRYLLAVLCLTGLFFMTLVKYHVISVAIATYFLAAIEDKKYLKTGGLLLGAAGTSVFVLNYFISFLVRGVAGNIDNSFYMNHFWNYAAGSLVYDNRIFINGIRTDVSIFYKLGSFVAAPVNLFLYGLFGLRLFPHDTLKHYLVASNGEKGNVVDAIGYLFPSKGSMVDILVFGLVILLFGALFSWIYHSLYLKSIRENRLPVMLAYFMTYFVFLSFFGTFYINLVPYEILFWCWVMMFVFDKRNIFIA